MRFEVKDEHQWHLWFAWHPVEVRRGDGAKEIVVFEKVLRKSVGSGFFSSHIYKSVGV